MFALPLSATTWFIRTDGGTRYSPENMKEGQCDGKADVAYPGKGINRHCAFNDVRYMWWNNVYGNQSWLMAGGDTLVIRGCSALPAQQNPSNPNCRIGWDNDTKNSPTNTWCWGVVSCAMPAPPSGTPAHHTVIEGGCAYDKNCNPVSEYPYTHNNLAQLFAGFRAPSLINMGGSQYVDFAGLELTTHNGKCAHYGTTNPLPQCLRGEAPLSDQADQGVSTNNTTGNISLTDVYIHGFSASGIYGPIGGPFTLTRVSIDFNAFAGWNLDTGGTPDGPGSALIQSYVTMIGNGCQEEYPIVHKQFPAKGCWDTNGGGFGDAWSGQEAKLDAFTCDHCNISFNTKDAAIGPHTQMKNLSITNSVMQANMGQQFKYGMQPGSKAWIANNLIVGDCNRMSQPIDGRNFNAAQHTPGAGLSGFCRAAGDIFSFFSAANSSVNIVNNTIVAESATIFDLSCQVPGACASTPYYLTNNVILGYDIAAASGSRGEPPAVYYFSDPKLTVVASSNLSFGVRNGDHCGQQGNLCVNPMLVNQPPQSANLKLSALDNFNPHPSASSPAVGHGKPVSGVSLDLFGHPRPTPPSIGAAEPQR